MKLGFLTAAFPDLTLGEVASWRRRKASRRSRSRVGPLPAASADVTRASLTSTWTLSTRTRCTNCSVGTDSRSRRSRTTRINLHPDAAHREEVNAHLLKVVDAAQALGVGVVGTFAGNDQTKSPPDNLVAFREVWPPLVAHAEERGVKIAIENLPDDLLVRRSGRAARTSPARRRSGTRCSMRFRRRTSASTWIPPTSSGR
jgi:hypothetical protein